MRTNQMSRLLSVVVILSLTNRDVMSMSHSVFSRVESYLSENCEAVSRLLPQVCQYNFWIPVNSPNCCSMFSLVDACSGSSCSGSYTPHAKRSLETLLYDPTFCSKVSEVGKYYCRTGSTTASCVALKCVMSLVCFDGNTKCDMRSRPVPAQTTPTPKVDHPLDPKKNPKQNPRQPHNPLTPVHHLLPFPTEPKLELLDEHQTQNNEQTNSKTPMDPKEKINRKKPSDPKGENNTEPPTEPHPDPETHANSHQRRARTFDLPETAACESTNLVAFDTKNLEICPAFTAESQVCGHRDRIYRTLSGRCNNLNNPNWGRSFESPKRLLKNKYDDRLNFPRTRARDGRKLMSVRYISREVCTDEPNLADKLSVVHMSFGQYIDHDITGFPVIKFNDTQIKCCAQNLDPQLKIENGGPCFPIEIPAHDDFFRTRCMEFIRSSAKLDNENFEIIPREQVNSITAFIDASTVYGSTDDFTNQFLDGKDGTLRVSPRDLLPRSNKPNCKLQDENKDFCQAAGDARVNVFPGLGMMHTVFHREHNRLVRGLQAVTGKSWEPMKYFNEARKILSAIHQVITYKEYLPSFLSPEVMTKYNLAVPTIDQFGRNVYKYKPSTNPQMSNAFSTAAFRYGHSQIQRTVKVGNHTRVPMQDTLMRPHLLQKFGVEDIILGMSTAFAENVDRLFVTAVTDRLFEKNPAERDGLDLVALNTQRGRDHGLPPYNSYRTFCGLPKIRSFSSAEPNIRKLGKVYAHPDDIDLFIGGISEKPLPGSQVGPTFACIMGQQFEDLKYGDRFWYENPRRPEGFTPEQLSELQKVTLSSVLCQNSNLRELQTNSFFFPDTVTNKVKPCWAHPKIDLTKWANE